MVRGSVAGMLTVLGFTILHDVLISDIWFSFLPMLAAGAACGAVLVWSYGALVPASDARSWFAYVAFHLGGLLGLGLASLALFDPVVPMRVVVAANEPPTELIARAMPLTAGWTLAVATAATLIWRGSLRAWLVTVAATGVLVILLGVNVSVLGLVELSDANGAVALFLGLIAVIMISYGTIMRGLSVASRSPGGVGYGPGDGDWRQRGPAA